jgi:hypothetical protein
MAPRAPRHPFCCCLLSLLCIYLLLLFLPQDEVRDMAKKSLANGIQMLVIGACGCDGWQCGL